MFVGVSNFFRKKNYLELEKIYLSQTKLTCACNRSSKKESSYVARSETGHCAHAMHPTGWDGNGPLSSPFSNSADVKKLQTDLVLFSPLPLSLPLLHRPLPVLLYRTGGTLMAIAHSLGRDERKPHKPSSCLRLLLHCPSRSLSPPPPLSPVVSFGAFSPLL